MASSRGAVRDSRAPCGARDKSAAVLAALGRIGGERDESVQHAVERVPAVAGEVRGVTMGGELRAEHDDASETGRV